MPDEQGMILVAPLVVAVLGSAYVMAKKRATTALRTARYANKAAQKLKSPQSQ